MTNAKAVVSKKVAEAIELTLESKNVPVVVAKIAEGRSIPNQRYKPLEGLSLETLMRALVNGYEVERSPEEQVREYYESYGGSPSAMERKAGIEDTLNLLGIKIEGVNA